MGFERKDGDQNADATDGNGEGSCCLRRRLGVWDMLSLRRLYSIYVGMSSGCWMYESGVQGKSLGWRHKFGSCCQ